MPLNPLQFTEQVVADFLRYQMRGAGGADAGGNWIPDGPLERLREHRPRLHAKIHSVPRPHFDESRFQLPGGVEQREGGGEIRGVRRR